MFMLHKNARVIRYLGALAGCLTLAGLTLHMARSEAQNAKAAPAQSAPAQSAPVASGRAVPIFGISIYPGYRDWKLVSVAHEEGSLNDIRAILGKIRPSKLIVRRRFRFLTARSLLGWPGTTFRRKRTTKS